GAGKPEPTGRASAPLGSRESVCCYALPASARRARHHPSMSRTGNCWDNASVESFFGTLTRELVYHRHYATRDDATRDIFEYIEVFYNRKRCHSTLGYDSPAEYEAKTAVA
ncbi:MAG: IS3 family transposase, partial [Nitrospirota bacterium]|nr:IS3 family transposase [Nitrospirota bacterium]